MRLTRWLTAVAVPLAVLMTPLPVLANQYEIFIEIETEEDLYDLQVARQISDETFATLLVLYQRGINLNDADRQQLYTLPNLTYTEVDAILDYREEVGFIADLAALVINGALSERKLAAIAPFLIVKDAKPSGFAANGFIRTQTRWTVEDDRVPPFGMQARIDTLQNVTIGFAGTITRNRIGTVVFDPTRQALSAEENDTQFNLPKFYVQYDNGEFGVIAGTYRIGFGQRLTFDVTNQPTPNGFRLDAELFRGNDLVRRCRLSTGELATSPCTGPAGDVYVTPDFKWRESLLGVAASARGLDVGSGNVDLHAFASYQPRRIYQYEIYDRGACDDPRDDDNDMCSSPDVFVTQSDRLELTPRFTFQTLPAMYAELTAGGHVTYNINRRGRIGVTGYGTRPEWLTEGIDLDFQEWSRFPFGGAWGAVGVDGAIGVGNTDVFGEVTRSFDNQLDGGGGFGAILRTVSTWGKNELEGSLRYYDDKFANPFARPIAAADEFDGNRARDEFGGRIRYNAMIRHRLNLRTSVDLWTTPSQDTVETMIRIRPDVELTGVLTAGLWFQYQDKDLGISGRDQCFEVSTEEDENGEPIPCAGQKFQFTVRARIEPSRLVFFTLQAQLEYLDEAATSTRPEFDMEYRKDVIVQGTITAKPHELLRVRARIRYLTEAQGFNSFMERSVWTYLDLTYKLRERDRLRIRYDYFRYLDGRSSTDDRTPNPEQWLWLEYQAKF